jgi:hemerythrin-like domain-containing protein
MMPRGDLVDVVHEGHAAVLEALHDVLVVHDFVVHVDLFVLAAHLEQLIDHVDRHVDTRHRNRGDWRG